MGIDYTKRPDAAESTASGGPISLTKVTLTKAAPTVSLTKQGSSTGLLRVNLNWTARPPSSGIGLFKAKKADAIDLDLGCLFEFVDGSKGVVQALGNRFEARPLGMADKVIWLDGDDRSGKSTGGENLFINLAYTDRIKRIMVFALIYEGVANWAAAAGVVTLYPVSGPQVEVHLDESRDGARICGIAMLEQAGGDLSIRREVNYINGSQSQLDEAYGWGMKWAPSHK